MSKTKIEWCDYTINTVKGLCPMACSYCYARRMYQRFKWNPEIRYIEPYWTYSEIEMIKKPHARIFVGSTMELFGDWIPDLWMKDTFKIINQFPQHTFIFLTKKPENLSKWSPFPENCWVGISVDGTKGGYYYQPFIGVKAKVKFISFEPLLQSLHQFNFQLGNIGWVIIGQQTPVKLSTMPKMEWIAEIVEACDKATIPVFEKNNLKDFIYGEYGGKYKQVFKYVQDSGRELRQEMPK